jgi:hypothetical protein
MPSSQCYSGAEPQGKDDAVVPGWVVEDCVKGLSHEIFRAIFWLSWIYLGLKGNRFWFLNFKDVS